MNLFLLLFLLLWLGCMAGLLIALAGLIIAAYVKKSRKFALRSFAAIVGGMLGATALFGGLCYLWVRPHDPTSDSDLKNAYRADFGTFPPPGVTVLKARQIVVGDAGGQWLLLKATPEEIERHIALGFKKAPFVPPDFSGKTGANAPGWWQPPLNRLELYENDQWSTNGGWYRSNAAMGVDRGSNLIWFAASKSS